MTGVRVGLIGLGNWGNRLAGVVDSVADLDLVRCYARNRERREAFAAEHGIEAAPSLDALLGSDIDAVLIATPHSTHTELVIAAAEAGKHVMVEKPLTLYAADARRCVRAAEEHGVVLQVAHYRRRHAATRMLRAAIDAGELGTLLAVEGRFNRSLGPDHVRPWRDDPAESPAGAMTALGIHLVDNFLYLAGPVRRVTAVTTRPLAITDLDDLTVALLEFENGCVGTLSTSLRLPFEASCAAYGTEAAAWSEDDGQRYVYQRRDETVRTEVAVTPVDGVLANLAAFADCVRTGSPSETGGEAAVAVIEVFEAIARSAAAGGTPVEIAGI